jgi:inosose dehydratase
MHPPSGGKQQEGLMPSDRNPAIDRRSFLTSVAAAAAAATSPGLLAWDELDAAKQAKAPWNNEPKPPYAPFRLAIQSYSLRKLRGPNAEPAAPGAAPKPDFEAAIEALFDLHVNFIEIWPDHLPPDVSQMDFRKYVKAMRQNMVWKIGYGVADFTADVEKARKVFDLGKKLNLFSISANPHPDSLPILDKMVEDYRIKVAIHNHGPEDGRYGKPELTEKALKGRHPSVGVCIDTGHFLLAGVDPVEAAKRFKDRVHAVHLKDVKTEGGKKKYCVLGQGDLDLVALLRVLKESKFKGGLSLEYEEEPENPIPSMEKCLKAVEEAVKKL